MLGKDENRTDKRVGIQFCSETVSELEAVSPQRDRQARIAQYRPITLKIAEPMDMENVRLGSRYCFAEGPTVHPGSRPDRARPAGFRTRPRLPRPSGASGQFPFR